MSIFHAVKHLLFPEKCRHCKKALASEGAPLCAACHAEYERVKALPCRRCGQAVSDCLCLPDYSDANVSRYLSVFHYDKRTPGGRLLLTVKDRKDHATLSFLSGELATVLTKSGALRENTVLCYVPRSPEKVLSTGIDQSKELATALSKRLHLPLVEALSRHTHGESQKEQNRPDRKKNADTAFFLHPNCPPFDGKQIILIDDILTTGATLSACTGCLKQAGAGEILCLTVGRR